MIRLRMGIALALLPCGWAWAWRPAVAISVKADVVNDLIVPVVAIRLLPAWWLEATYFEDVGDFSGHAVRTAVRARWGEWLKPYAGFGYLRLRQDMPLGEAAVQLYGESGSATLATRADLRLEGDGPQVFAGVQIFPFNRLPRLRVDLELAHALFDVEGRLKVQVQGTGALSGLTFERERILRSDYEATSAIVALSYGF